MASLISRRTFIAGSALVLGGRSANAQESQELIAEPKTSKLFGEGPPTQHWHFRSKGDLPVVSATQGRETRLRLLNHLEEDIWIHLYGLRIEATMATVLLPKGPEGSVELVFTPPDAGTFWIGPLLNASKQREMGLYAMLIVQEVESPFEDLPIFLDDWALGDDGTLDRKFGNMEVAAGEGRLGNWYTVNGAAKPVIALPDAKPSRLRFLNVCNARTLNMQLKGAEALIIAMDGQPIAPAPLPEKGLNLAPGQRADIVPVIAVDDMALTFDLGADTLEAAFFTHGSPPQSLQPGFSLAANPWPALLPETPLRSIPVVLEGGINGGLRQARVGNETLELRALLERGLAWAISGTAGLQQVPLFAASQGEAIVLAFENKTGFAQPVAIDGHVWHQLTENDAKAEGQFWRDTAVIPPRAKASYVFVAANPGLWTLSSLVAERADAGLIGSFSVNAGP